VNCDSNSCKNTTKEFMTEQDQATKKEKKRKIENKQ
jgi:hypothetical protein